MFFSLLMVVIAVFLAYSVFTGKGKLMAVENIKKDKIGTYKKWLRILYAVMMVIVLLMAFFNFVEKVAYVQTNYYEFTEDYLGADEKVHPAGESHPTDEMIEILINVRAEDGRLLIAVSDTGAGISEDRLEKIREKEREDAGVRRRAIRTDHREARWFLQDLL